jgi:hypothetical protein
LFNRLKLESNEKYEGFCAEGGNVPSTNLAVDFVERKSLEYEIQREEYPLFEWTEDQLLVSKIHSKRRFPRSPSSWMGNTDEEIDFQRMVETVSGVLQQTDEIQETKPTVSRTPGLEVYLEEHSVSVMYESYCLGINVGDLCAAHTLLQLKEGVKYS